MGDDLFKWNKKNEAAWNEFKRHIEWAEGFWVVFVFTPSPMSAETLQQIGRAHV